MHGPRSHLVIAVAVATLLLVLLGACDSEEAGDPADTVGDTVVDPDKGLKIDYSTTSGGVVPRYEPGSSDFTATPWPTDDLRRADGTVDLSTFPNPQAVTLITEYLDYGGKALDGWSRNGAVYFQLSDAIDLATLPADAASMTDPKALAQLVDLTAGGPTYGRQFPLLFDYDDGASDLYYLGPTLAMRPVYGFPLADGGTYCALMTRAIKDAAGNYLEPAPAFLDALANRASLQPLRDWLDGASRLARGDVAAATCFTTQDATRDMRRIQAFLQDYASTPLFDVVPSGSTSHYHQIEARYLGPNFQRGDKPYRDSGGDVVFDASGDPIVQESETIRVRILIPRSHPMPPAGWPVVVYSHGTGGDWQSCLDATGTQVLEEGLAMLCIDQPLHGIRGVGGEQFLDSFNFLNPESGRMSFRQAAADNVWLTRLISDGRFDLAAAATGFGAAIEMDPDTIVFFGHSHGGLAGIILLGVDPRVKGAVLSGASGVLAETLLRRKDIVDLKVLLAQVTQVEITRLDTFHPVVTLAQLLVDATDPINYAPYWLEPVTGGNSKHVFMTEGTADEASPAVGADAVAAAAGIPLIEPVAQVSRAHELKGLAPVTMPVNSNLISTTGQLVTGGIRQFPGGDHFVAFDDFEAQTLWRGFLRAFRAGEVPIIAP